MSFEKELHSYTEVILPVGGLCDPNVIIGCLRDQAWLCVLLVSNARGCCLAPRRDNTRGSLSPTILMFDPNYNMMPPYFSTATDILLIKINLKFESRATAVSVATSPRYLRGKYSSRPHPRSRKCACQFLQETERVKSNCFPWRQRGWSCGVFKSWISDAHCPSQRKWQVLHNYDISVLQQVGIFFNGIACLVKDWPLIKREFPRVPMTWRSARVRMSNVTSQM